MNNKGQTKIIIVLLFIKYGHWPEVFIQHCLRSQGGSLNVTEKVSLWLLQMSKIFLVPQKAEAGNNHPLPPALPF